MTSPRPRARSAALTQPNADDDYLRSEKDGENSNDLVVILGEVIPQEFLGGFVGDVTVVGETSGE